MKGRSFSLFQASINSEHTRKVYTYSLNEFMKFSKINQCDDIPKLHTDKIQSLLENWVMHLKKKGLRATTIKAKLCGVELFLDMNRVIFHKKILHKLVPPDDDLGGGEVPFTTEEIQRMLLGTTKLRTKALINFLASTGARPACLDDPVLRIKHLVDMPKDCKAVKLYEGSREGYWGFLTPEASVSLAAYLASRRRNGEKQTPESPLFANFSTPNWSKKHDHLSSKSVREIITGALKMGGIERTKSGQRYDKAIVYGFRKRFNTILKLNNNVNSNIAEKLMAHKSGLDGSYLKPTREQCFEEFSKAIPELTISDEARDKFRIINLEKEKSKTDLLQEQVNEQAHAIERLMGLANDQNDYIEDYSERVLKMLDPDTLRQEVLSKLRSSGITKENEAYLTSLTAWKNLKKSPNAKPEP